jgi:hypothetical protein
MSRKTILSLRTNLLTALLLLALSLNAQAQSNTWLSVGYEGQFPDFGGINEVVAARNQLISSSLQPMPEFQYLQGINVSLGNKFQNNFIEAGYSFLRQSREGQENFLFNRGLRVQASSVHLKLGYANLERSNLYAFGGILQRDQLQIQTHQSVFDLDDEDIEWYSVMNQALWSAGAFIRLQFGALAFEPYYLWPIRNRSTASLQPLQAELLPGSADETSATFRPGGFGFRVSLLISGPVRDTF